MRARQLLVLEEVLVEAPGPGGGRGLAQAGLDETVGGEEILVDQEAGGHQRPADRVQMLRGLLLGEVGGQPEGVHAPAEERLQRAFIFAVGQPSQDRPGARALQRGLGRRGAFAQGADGREAFLVGRLVGLLRRHLAQRQLVDDVAGLDHPGQGLQRQLELVERAVALVDLGVMAFQAVAVQEVLHPLLRRLGALQQAGGRGQRGGQEAAGVRRDAECRGRQHGAGLRAQENRPVLLPKASVSTPIFWAMST